MKNLLVIIDMVNGFVKQGNLADPTINKITPNIINLIQKANANGTPIVAFKDCHSYDDEEFNTYPIHCIDRTYESEIIDELAPYRDSFCEIKKDTTNGFITKKFRAIAQKHEFDNVIVCGCCTDICVENFVKSYLAFNKQMGRKTKITVVSDACYTFDGQNHNAKEYHINSLKKMQALGANVISLNNELNFIKE